jgi:dTMP kinase
VFVTVEGVEGAGKSSQVARLAAELRAGGRTVVVTREPGGTPAGEQVRRILLDADPHAGSALHPRTEALLFAAARAQLVEEVIRPALARGEVVLCDRYVHSSLAYQGAARGLGLDHVERLNRWATADLWPDLVILLDLDPAEGLARRSAGRDRIESEELAFHQEVRAAFLELAAADPSRFAVIDASRPPAEVAADVHAAVRRLLQTVSP